MVRHVKRRTAKPRPRQWTLAELRKACGSAPTVWLALTDMATDRSSAIVTPTRQMIADATGIKKPLTISRALTALECGGWIDRAHIPVINGGIRTATLLRLVLRRGTWHLRRKHPKRDHTKKPAVESQKGTKGKVPKRDQDSLSERGAPLGFEEPTVAPPKHTHTDAEIAELWDRPKGGES
jgi:hypothetical protein